MRALTMLEYEGTEGKGKDRFWNYIYVKETASVMKLLLKEYIWINLIDIKGHKYIFML